MIQPARYTGKRLIIGINKQRLAASPSCAFFMNMFFFEEASTMSLRENQAKPMENTEH
jgi:hypothetical protein